MLYGWFLDLRTSKQLEIPVAAVADESPSHGVHTPWIRTWALWLSLALITLSVLVGCLSEV